MTLGQPQAWWAANCSDASKWIQTLSHKKPRASSSKISMRKHQELLKKGFSSASVWSQELEPTMLVGPFQHRIILQFYDLGKPMLIAWDTGGRRKKHQRLPRNNIQDKNGSWQHRVKKPSGQWAGYIAPWKAAVWVTTISTRKEKWTSNQA